MQRGRLLALFARLPPTEVALEACGSSHHWGRALQRLGHRVRLVPPQSVKPFVKRARNDRNDALATSEAAGLPAPAPAMLALPGERTRESGDQIATLDAPLKTMHQAMPASQRLAAIPGVGPLSAVTLALSINPPYAEPSPDLPEIPS